MKKDALDDVYGGNYKVARAEALARSNGICQFCGLAKATQSHHWARDYPAGSECQSKDLTALCEICHKLATRYRRFLSCGGTRWEFMASLKERGSNAVSH
jgi:hypothetical protein